MWIFLPINPEPWAIGPLGVGKKNGKFFPYVGRNNQLASYKEAVKEELESQGIQQVDYYFYELTFYFWRRLESNTSGSKMNYADATNLQKATEDALQGVLIENDRDVVEIRSVVVEQSPDARGCVVIHVEESTQPNTLDIPDEMWDKVRDIDAPSVFDNSWGGPT